MTNWKTTWEEAEAVLNAIAHIACADKVVEAIVDDFSEEELEEVCATAWQMLRSGEPWCFGSIKGAAELAVYAVANGIAPASPSTIH